MTLILLFLLLHWHFPGGVWITLSLICSMIVFRGANHVEAVSKRPIYRMPDPLTYLDGGYHAMNCYVFALLQILGLVLMTILVAVSLIATTFISIRSIIWFGASGIFLFPLFVSAGCLVSQQTNINRTHHDIPLSN